MSYLIRASVLLSTVLGLAHATQAQQVTVDSIKLARIGGLYLPASRRALMFSLQPENGNTTRLRHYVFDASLRRRARQDVYLPGRVTMVNAATSRHHLLYQFRRRGTDSLLTLVVDTTGRVVHKQAERQRGLPWQELRGALAPLSEGFLTEEPSRRHDKTLVRYLAPNLQQQWEHRFTSTQGKVAIEQAVLDSTHLWLVVSTNAQSRRATAKAYCLELATGRVLCRMPLDYNNERRVPAVGAMGPGHSLLLAGYTFTGNRPSRTSTGQLFYTRITPDSSRQFDRRIALSQEARMLSAQGRKVLWEALQPDAAGNVRLVGETYTSTSFGGHMAIAVATGIATLGIAYLNTTTLRPRDVVTLKLMADGQVAEVRSLPLPEAGSYTVGGYLQARRMAEAAARAGVFRLRGFTPDSNRIVLRSARRVLTYDLRTGQPVTVREVPANGYFDIWFAEAKQMLLYHEQRMPQRVTLQQAAY
ncbi:hypothetical protein [Hymenobacter rigui]|uniref:Uncharacterized protein n=1 Tax=Hymenobacter rigui TaxID=334424 RepID=A0A3R9MT90_9BACT|nr:hypothetical protein [Hymenobacter rigui]RSK49512.1 hypothetical protein EI291_08460 [Hymenobacter rigui]